MARVHEHSSHDDHEHDHDHARDHEHDHPHGGGLLGKLGNLLPFFHGHSHGGKVVDNALEGSERGIWAIKVSIAALGLATLLQAAIYWVSGSVALLADTIHNFVDAVNGIPLWIALALSRRSANRRYTYGYGRAEDLAGLVIVVLIAVSAAVAGYESYQRLVDPRPLGHSAWLIAAALIGFLGNEAVAFFETRVGKEIGSEALITDGQHARVDGLTSLAVIGSVAGNLLGWPLLDPIIGLLITVAILFILKDTARAMWHRLMDAVDPAIVASIEQEAGQVAGVQQVHNVRVRWLGHRLEADLHVIMDEDLPLRESHRIVEEVRHALFHAEPRLAVITVHGDPCGHSGVDHHAPTAHHREQAVAEPHNG